MFRGLSDSLISHLLFCTYSPFWKIIHTLNRAFLTNYMHTMLMCSSAISSKILSMMQTMKICSIKILIGENFLIYDNKTVATWCILYSCFYVWKLASSHGYLSISTNPVYPLAESWTCHEMGLKMHWFAWLVMHYSIIIQINFDNTENTVVMSLPLLTYWQHDNSDVFVHNLI